MIPLPERLELAMHKRGIRKKADVARACKVSTASVADWFNGKTKELRAETARLAGDFFGCDRDWIGSGLGEPRWSDESSVEIEPARPAAPPSSAPRPVWVCGSCQGGMPERIFEDGWLSEATEFAEVISSDEHAFCCRVVGDSMVPRYQPGEYALVEPSGELDLEDDVLVRLSSGETMLQRLLSRRGGWRFGSYNSQEILHFRHEDVTWVYYVAHAIPAKKIKPREELANFLEKMRRSNRMVPVEPEPRGKYFSDRPMPDMERVLRADVGDKEKKL